LRAPAESKVASSGAAILLVEDDADLAEMFGLGLSSAGHAVTVAGDGDTAIDSARRERFDLVLLDVHLPRIDGLTTLAVLRAGRSTKDLPVAMLTNSNDQALRASARSLGILDWLVKSDTTPAELARRARAWTSRKEVTTCLSS
jgi:two-component system chemotaxis response regulator CheY